MPESQQEARIATKIQSVEVAGNASKYPEKPKAEIERVNILSNRFSRALCERLDQQGLVLDSQLFIRGFEVKIRSLIEKVFSNPDIPESVKNKFERDILSKIDILAKVTLADVKNLQHIRAVWTLGLEPLERLGTTPAQDQLFFLMKILDVTIGNYIEPVAFSLNEVFFKDKQFMIDGKVYHRENFEATQKKLQELDARYGFDFAPRTKDYLSVTGSVRSDARRDFLEGIFMKNLFLKQMIRNGIITSATKDTLGKQAEITIKGKTINLIDAYLDYKNVIDGCKPIELEVRNTRQIALADDVFAQAKKGIGANELKSHFDHILPKDIEAKIKESSLADMMIIGVQLGQVFDVTGITLGVDGIVGSTGGISLEGEKLSKLERTFGVLFGILGITIVGGSIARAHRAGKLAGLLRAFHAMKEPFITKLSALLQKQGTLPKDSIVAIMGIAKMMGKDAYNTVKLLVQPIASTVLKMKLQTSSTQSTPQGLTRQPKIDHIGEKHPLAGNDSHYTLPEGVTNIATAQKVEQDAMGTMWVDEVKGTGTDGTFGGFNTNGPTAKLAGAGSSSNPMGTGNTRGGMDAITDKARGYSPRPKSIEQTNFTDMTAAGEGLQGKYNIVDIKSGNGRIFRGYEVNLGNGQTGLVCQSLGDNRYLAYVIDETSGGQKIIHGRETLTIRIINTPQKVVRNLPKMEAIDNLRAFLLVIGVAAPVGWGIGYAYGHYDELVSKYDELAFDLFGKTNFNLSDEIKKIQSLPPEQQKTAIELIRKNISEQIDSARIFKQLKEDLYTNPLLDINQYCEINRISRQNSDGSINILKPQLHRALNLYHERHQKVRKYYERFGGDGKNMIKNIYGENMSGNVDVEIHGSSIVFLIEQDKDYEMIGSAGSAGFNSDDLSGGFIAVRKKNWNYAKVHEIQHSDDRLISKYRGVMESSLKTEVVARIAEGRTQVQSKYDLLREDGIYNYYKDLQKPNPQQYLREWGRHTKLAEYYINIAYLVKKQYPDNTAFILSFTKIEDWDKLLIDKLM